MFALSKQLRFLQARRREVKMDFEPEHLPSFLNEPQSFLWIESCNRFSLFTDDWQVSHKLFIANDEDQAQKTC